MRIGLTVRALLLSTTVGLGAVYGTSITLNGNCVYATGSCHNTDPLPVGATFSHDFTFVTTYPDTDQYRLQGSITSQNIDGFRWSLSGNYTVTYLGNSTQTPSKGLFNGEVNYSFAQPFANANTQRNFAVTNYENFTGTFSPGFSGSTQGNMFVTGLLGSSEDNFPVLSETPPPSTFSDSAQQPGLIAPRAYQTMAWIGRTFFPSGTAIGTSVSASFIDSNYPIGPMPPAPPTSSTPEPGTWLLTGGVLLSCAFKKLVRNHS